LIRSGSTYKEIKAKLWGIHEIEIINQKAYENPYRDVELNVEYIRPDGSTIDFWGFYDDNRTWRARFMPDMTGLWKYKAVFSDGTQGSEGSFECVEADIPGMISKDESNPVWFGYKGGKHVLIRSFHVGDRFFAENWLQESRKQFLDWVQEHKYNMLSIASHYLNRDSEGRGRGWKTPCLWKDGNPCAEEYTKMESILNELAERKILVFPFGGFFGRDARYPRSEEDKKLYIRYTLARIGAYWNIMLNVAGPEPLHEDFPYMSGAELDYLGEYISSVDVFKHLLTIHNKTGPDEFKDKGYTSFGTLQGPKTTDRKALYEGLINNHTGNRPLLAHETLWYGNKYHPQYTDDDLRKNAYVIMMSACALNFAENNGDSSTAFSGTMDIKDADASKHEIIKGVWDFFETVPYYTMIPRKDLVNNGFCLAEEGKRYLIYLESGGRVDVKVKKGIYKVEWINARNTVQRIDGGKTEDGKGFEAPDSNDWILELQLC